MASLTLIAGCSRERIDWKSAEAADTQEAYDHFLERHPDSELATQARARIAQLAEDKDWQARHRRGHGGRVPRVPCPARHWQMGRRSAHPHGEFHAGLESSAHRGSIRRTGDCVAPVTPGVAALATLPSPRIVPLFRHTRSKLRQSRRRRARARSNEQACAGRHATRKSRRHCEGASQPPPAIQQTVTQVLQASRSPQPRLLRPRASAFSSAHSARKPQRWRSGSDCR